MPAQALPRARRIVRRQDARPRGGHGDRLPAPAAPGLPHRRDPVDRQRLGQLSAGREQARGPGSHPARLSTLTRTRPAARALVRALPPPAQPVAVPALRPALLDPPGARLGRRRGLDRQPGGSRPVLAAASLQLGYADRVLGRLVAHLRETGLYDKALLVVTADHGISFRAGEKRRPLSDANLQDIAYVPLFVKLRTSGTGAWTAHRRERSTSPPRSPLRPACGFRGAWTAIRSSERDRRSAASC